MTGLNTPISGLPTGGAVSDNDLFPAATPQGATVKRTAKQMLSYFGGPGAPGTPGAPGAQGEPGPSGPSGNAQNITTVSAFTASAFDVGTKVVNIQGYYTVGTGSLCVRRVNSQPAHPWKFRSTDRFTAAGGTDATNGGWWEGYVEVEGVHSADAHGFVEDGVTDNSAAWTDWQNYCLNNGSPIVQTLRFGAATYYFASPIKINSQMIVEGTGGEAPGAYGQMTVLLFATYITGIVINRHNTDGITALPDFTNPGADGTIIRNLSIQAKVAVGQNYPLYPFAYGVFAKARFHMEDCFIQNWACHCVAIIATAGVGGWAEGNANGWTIERCRIVNCAGSCLFILGADVNAGSSKDLDMGTATFGIQDESFLGNSHYSPQVADIGTGAWWIWGGKQWTTSYNGNFYTIIPAGDISTQQTAAQTTPPSGTTSDNAVWQYRGPGTPTPSNGFGIWGQVQDDDFLVYTVIPGQEANMWTHKPSTNPAVWGTGAPYVSGFTLWWPTASQMATMTGVYATQATTFGYPCGPYVSTGSYRMSNANAWGTIYNGYVEGGSTECYATGKNMFLSGNINLNAYSASLFINSSLSVLQASQTWRVWKTDGTWIDLGDPQKTLGGILGFTDNTHWPLGFKLQQDAGNKDYVKVTYNNGNTATYLAFGGPSAGVPYSTIVYNMIIGEGSYLRRLTFNNAPPGSGAHTAGEFWHNATPSVTNGAFVLGWKCTADGTPGTWEAVQATSVPIYAPCTYAQLVAPATAGAGARGFITDSTIALSFGAIVSSGGAAGGGANKGPIYCDGTDWRYG